MPPSPLNLPSIPPELKAISPHLQRAEELKTKDPIMAYWCAYYSAQVGIGLKAKEPAARSFLFELLGTLEHLKKEIGPNDAIDEESASSAFVENFALKVFSSADDEDRRGDATRATAKKFLAAANFLETLLVFEPANSATSSNSDKIRYAKWKASDIAKAFREGRKPTPGPAGGTESPPFPPTSTAANEVQSTDVTPATPPPLDQGSPLNLASSPPAITRSTPPPPQLGILSPSPFLQPSSADPTAPDHLLPSGFVDPRVGAVTPGAWSTAATPGSPAVFRFGDDSQDSTPTTRAWVSEELEGAIDDYSNPVMPAEDGEFFPTDTAGGQKQVRFTPSVTGDIAIPKLSEGVQDDDQFDTSVVVNPPIPPRDSFSLPSAPSFNPGYDPQISSSAPALPPPPPPPELSEPRTPLFPSKPHPTSQLPRPAISPPTRIAYPAPEASTVTQAPPVELTPQVIAQIQKRCKFAISALDYEDAAQARKELREALKLLGG